MLESVERKIPLETIASISISELQDDIVVMHIPAEWDAVLETVFKTELLTLMAEKYKAVARKNLQINFGNQLIYKFINITVNLPNPTLVRIRKIVGFKS